MGTNYRRDNLSAHFASTLTTRLIDITTGAATQVCASTGAVGMRVTNVGETDITWGDSSIVAQSGGLLFYASEECFDNIRDDFCLFFRALSSGTSVVGKVAVTEFG